MAIYELDGNAPQLSEGVYIAQSAEMIGKVELHAVGPIFGQKLSFAVITILFRLARAVMSRMHRCFMLTLGSPF